MNSKTLPIELLVSNAESVRYHNDMLSAFGSTQEIKPSRYGSIPPSTGSSSILNPEREEERLKDREKGKTINIDHFMEELKHEHELR
ncbi:unnamed protein product, partial [Linum tenue]